MRLPNDNPKLAKVLVNLSEALQSFPVHELHHHAQTHVRDAITNVVSLVLIWSAGDNADDVRVRMNRIVIGMVKATGYDARCDDLVITMLRVFRELRETSVAIADN